MPFKSEKQRKYLWANEPEIARDWTDTYGSRIHKDIGGIATLQDGYVNYTKGSDSVTVPKKFKARKDATPTHLAYITKAEAAQLKKQNKGTPHKGPKGIPSYDDYDAKSGSYTSGEAMSAAESGRQTADTRAHGMTARDVAAHHQAAQAAARASDRQTKSQSDGILNKFKNWQNNYNTAARMKHIQSKLDPKQIMKLVELGLVEYDDTQPTHYGTEIKATDLLSSGDSLKTLQDQFDYTGGMLNPADDKGEGQPYIWPPSYTAAESSPGTTTTTSTSNLGSGHYLVPLPYVQNQTRAADGGRIPAAYGGIMDTYTGRRKYGFGSFFKKITKPFKKALKSPIGKLALMGGLGYLATPGTGASIFSPQGKGKWWKKLLMDSVDSSGRSADVLGLLSKGKKLLSNPWVSIPAASAAAGLMTAKQPVEDLDNVQSRWDADKAAFDAYLASLDDEDSYRVPDEYILATGGRVGKQEGGLMDLGGMEKDYRNDGGFVPIGGQEKADDVPARLSRNEFVFTADAVRSAGGGDIDKGAEVMENVMKNLEAGGKVSEESQGKGGAQEMFEVSERLSEVM